MGAAAGLQEATGAPVAAFHQSGLEGYRADLALFDDTELAGLTAVHTPGHAPDHLCFQFFLPDQTKILFSGDHVMSWSSSIVSPPEGDMLAYYRSLKRVMARDDIYYLPGHGPVLPEPQNLAAELLAHRQKREDAILSALREQNWSVAALAAELYGKVNPALKFAATRNVLAHMLKLRDEGIVTEQTPDPNLHPDIASLAQPPPDQLPPGVTMATIDTIPRRHPPPLRFWHSPGGSTPAAKPPLSHTQNPGLAAVHGHMGLVAGFVAWTGGDTGRLEGARICGAGGGAAVCGGVCHTTRVAAVDGCQRASSPVVHTFQ